MLPRSNWRGSRLTTRVPSLTDRGRLTMLGCSGDSERALKSRQVVMRLRPGANATGSPEYRQVLGDHVFSSGHPAMQALNPRVYQMIVLDVLNAMGRLSSTKGDEITARKANGQNQFQDLSPAEKQWLEEAVRCIVRRLGEHAAGAQGSVITMADLPRI